MLGQIAMPASPPDPLSFLHFCSRQHDSRDQKLRLERGSTPDGITVLGCHDVAVGRAPPLQTEPARGRLRAGDRRRGGWGVRQARRPARNGEEPRKCHDI